MSTWADARKGDRVRAAGKVFEVKKIKGSGKKRDVVLDGPGGRIELTVKAKASIDLARRINGGTFFGPADKVEKLHDDAGRMQRWAKPEEAEAIGGPLLGPGDPSVTAPPAKAKGSPWDVATDDPERAILDGLDAALIAEGDPAVGYYVPPVDLETVRSHLMIFHERQPFGSEVDALAEHDAEHRAAEAGAAILPIQHWHVRRRP